MVRLPFRRKRKTGSDALEGLLSEAKAGDPRAREQLLADYQPFVERVASSTCGRSIGRTDDEFQIALLAMNESIDAYQADRGGFIRFAETVMRRRLIDSFRAKGRGREIPFSSFEEEDEEGNIQNIVEVQSAVRVFSQQEEIAARREEIERYGVELKRFGLTFESLAEICPKHADARESAIVVAKLIAKDSELRALFIKKHALPLRQLQGKVGVSRKTLERQRNYIVAIILLLLGDYELLHSFVEKGRER